MQIQRLALMVGVLSSLFIAPIAVRADEQPSYASGSETLHGRIASIDGHYALRVNDDRGYIDHVQMHQGTVIDPIGLSLANGMRVTIYGHADGRVFDADEIETPYHETGYYAQPVPVAVYPYPVYPYPVYDYPYYGPAYGSSYSIVIGGYGGHYGGDDRHGWRR